MLVVRARSIEIELSAGRCAAGGQAQQELREILSQHYRGGRVARGADPGVGGEREVARGTSVAGDIQIVLPGVHAGSDRVISLDSHPSRE